MKNLKWSVRTGLSVVLLLCFSVTLIPADLFHNHTYTPAISCKSDQEASSCTHKLHITKKADYCWACAVHVDKSHSSSTFFERLSLNPGVAVVIDNDIAGFVISLFVNTLRGPPAR